MLIQVEALHVILGFTFIYSDWLRAVQFECNTSAKSVTQVQITHLNSGL